MTCTQSTADFLCVVGPISQYAIGATVRPTTQALQRRNGIEQGQRLGRVVAIRAGQFDCQWNATPVTDQMAFAVPFRLSFAPNHLICSLKCTESDQKLPEVRPSSLRCCA